MAAYLATREKKNSSIETRSAFLSRPRLFFLTTVDRSYMRREPFYGLKESKKGRARRKKKKNATCENRTRGLSNHFLLSPVGVLIMRRTL